MEMKTNEPECPRKTFYFTSLFDGHRFRSGVTGLTIEGQLIGSIHDKKEDESRSDDASRVFYLGKKTVLPGFIDGHSHFLQMGLATLELDLSNIYSRSDLFDVLRDEVRQRKDAQPIIGRDWDESPWSDNRVPSRAELDSISSEVPIFVRRVCGHLAVLNSPALAKLRTKRFRGDYTNGIAIEETVWAFDEQVAYSDEDYEQALMNAQNLAFQQGVTTVHEITSPGNFKKYQHWSMTGTLKNRVVIYLPARYVSHYTKSGLLTGYGSHNLSFGGLKVFIDGSLGARTAALSRPYHGERTNKGLIIYPRSRLTKLLRKSRDAGFPLMIHAIGDRAMVMTLDVFEREYGAKISDLRHRLEHIEVLDSDLINRLENSGLIASCQPNFAIRWSQPPDGMNWERLGPERVRWCNPYARLLDRDIKVAFGSDCMPFGPLYGLEGAINHPLPELSVSLEQALAAYTTGSAYAGYLEKHTGTIEPGRKADLVVLDRDISQAKTLTDVKVDLTVLNGEIVYDRNA